MVNFFIYLIFICFKNNIENEKPEAKQKRLEAQFANLQIVSNVDKLGTAKVNLNLFYIEKYLL